jgi:protein ImuB
MYGVMYGADTCEPDALLTLAREWSPRMERVGAGREIVLDLSGLTRLFGDARGMATELHRAAAARGQPIRVAIAATRTAARLLVRHRAGVTVVAAGAEAEALAVIPVDVLARLEDDEAGKALDADLVRTFRQWGLRTLGDLAALPADALAARLGQAGVRLHHAARGADPRPLVPHVPEERFEQALDLEWPIEGLEPLSFVLGRLLEPLSAHLERRDRGAAILHVRLHLVTRAVHERALQLPIPLREARALRTLILLDLESQPPPAAIDRVVVAVDPTPARVVQFSLLARPLPSPEQISTLLARLQALMGETRCGSPAAIDTWRPGACAMSRFAPEELDPMPRERRMCDAPARAVRAARPHISGTPVMALRRFRTPVVARVRAAAGRPTHVTTDVVGLPGGRVERCAGPWRTAGGWWGGQGGQGCEGARVRGCEGAGAKVRGCEGARVREREWESWDRDEWDVQLGDGTTCRIFRARDTGRWFVEGVVD